MEGILENLQHSLISKVIFLSVGSYVYDDVSVIVTFRTALILKVVPNKLFQYFFKFKT